MHPESALEALGLTPKEARIDMALLSLGEATAYEIANKSGVKRPTVYIVLEELRKHGLVLKIPHAKKQVFIAKDPREFVAEEKKKIANAEAALPKLLALAKKNGKPNILYFEGKEGFNEALKVSERYMKGQEVVGFYAFVPDLTDAFIKLVRDHTTRLAESGTRLRGLTPDHPSAHTTADQLIEAFGWDIRFVPMAKYSSKVSIEATESMVRILSAGEGQSIIIESTEIADGVRQMFELAWGRVKDGEK